MCWVKADAVVFDDNLYRVVDSVKADHYFTGAGVFNTIYKQFADVSEKHYFQIVVKRFGQSVVVKLSGYTVFFLDIIIQPFRDRGLKTQFIKYGVAKFES